VSVANNHAATLPYPDRTEPTAGSCLCGWTVVYGWGEHGDAADAAAGHIKRTAKCDTYEIRTGTGERRIRSGGSL